VVFPYEIRFFQGGGGETFFSKTNPRVRRLWRKHCSTFGNRGGQRKATGKAKISGTSANHVGDEGLYTIRGFRTRKGKSGSRSAKLMFEKMLSQILNEGQREGRHNRKPRVGESASIGTTDKKGKEKVKNVGGRGRRGVMGEKQP